MSHTPVSHAVLSDAEYTRFRDLIVDRTGLLFGERRREALARAIAENTAHAGLHDNQSYFAHLQTQPTNSELWNHLVRALTINETYFFRDPDQIEALRRHILPDLIARHWTDHTLRLWSAGCSTGEEPYTLAILLRQLLPDIDRWKILILATDINRKALQVAAEGRYRVWSFRQTDSVLRQAYFTAAGDYFELAPQVRQMVTLAYLNLAEPTYPSADTRTQSLDLILCRNVAIYLPERLISQLAQRFYQCLTPGGWLIVGPSETNDAFYSQFQTLRFTHAIVYQKVAPANPASELPSTRSREAGVAHAPAGWVTPLPAASATPAPNGAGFIPWPAQGQPAPMAHESPAAKPAAMSSAVPQAADAAALLQKGEVLLKQRRYEDARQCFTACLAHLANPGPALYQLARLEANAGRLREARQWAERALEADPLQRDAHYVLALIHQGQGENDLALARLKKVLYLDPDFVLAHLGLSTLYQQAGHLAEAARHRELAVRLAARLTPETVLPGSEDLTAEQVLIMAHTL